MKYIIYTLIKFFISFLDLLVPRNNGLWVFYITPHTCWDANMQCVFALAREQKQANCIIVHLHPEKIPDIPNHVIFPLLSFIGFWHCLRSNVIFFDHAVIPGITNYRRISINLWHGIPIKKIRYFCKDIFPRGYLSMQRHHTSRLISSSAVDRLAMISSFQMPPEQVAVTGLPRNDILLNRKKYTNLLPSLAEELESIHNLKKDRKLVLYAPTYREKGHNKHLIPTLTRTDEDRIAAILKANNAILGIRDHVFSSTPLFPSLLEHGQAFPMSAKIFSNTNLLLTSVDLLITDYSSIWVDFLLLQRPILAFCPDLEEYLLQRGFLYDFKKTFPGTITHTTSELINNMELCLQNESNTQYQTHEPIRHLFHKYSDAMNTERVLELTKQ